MGVVWRAVDERLERSVAVKKVVGQHGLSPADRAELHARAMREAKNAARLQHPNAIMVFDITEHEGEPCLVMEYLPSNSLSELLNKRGTLPVPEVARIGEQMASALVAAHQAGIVHRDVKPGNILINDAGVAKLTDFGISRATGDMTLTATGLVGGTPAYLAPELARGADPAPASDVFALGATLYHAIEGHSPYGSNPNQLALLHTAASGKIQPPQQAGPVSALLMSMLRPDPDDRISMAQAAERLHAVAVGLGVPDAHAELPAPPTRTLAAAAPPRRGGTAVFDAVPPSPPPPRRPAAAASSGPSGPSGPKKRNFALVGGVLGLLGAVTVAIVLLLNGQDTDKQAGDRDGQQTTQQPPPSKQEKPKKQASGQIQFRDAGNLVVDFYTFPDGVDASWNMLTAKAQEKYGDQASFEKHWSKFDGVWSNTAVGRYNDDGSVTISITVTYQKDGKQRDEQREVRVVRENGELRIDSGTR